MSELFDEKFEQAGQDDSGMATEFPAELDEPLSPQMMGQVQGLLQLGELHDQFEYLGHEFHIRTMRIGEELAALAQIKGFQDVPLAQGRAYATAMVAGAIESVDGQPIIGELGPGDRSNAAQKFAKVSKWYYYVIDYIYKKYVELEKAQAETLEALQAKLEPEHENEPVEELSETSV
jgi:hypothetical protein